jgi:hypothetical protein
MGTRGAWARDFLIHLGNIAPTPKTINLVAAWTRQEFGSHEPQAASYNPMATTLDYGTNTIYNSHNVRNYATREQGIQALSMTLRGNHQGYADILSGLRENDPEKALSAMHRSPWGTNFGRVEEVWRSTDVTGELLPGEDPGKWKSNTPARVPIEQQEPTDEDDLADDTRETVEGTADDLSVVFGTQLTGEDVRYSVLAMAGAACIALGAIFAIWAISKQGIASTVKGAINGG